MIWLAISAFTLGVSVGIAISLTVTLINRKDNGNG